MANFEVDDNKSSGMKAPDQGTSGIQSLCSGFSDYAKKLFDQSLCWNDVKWLTQITHLPVIVKGVLTAEDAQMAYWHGAKGVIVSNHGARQLDSAPATIEALPEIVAAMKHEDCEVFLDGGIRTGNDAFKALAIGAKMVFVGRPVLWGLATQGKTGVKNVLSILHDELDTTMALSGCRNLQEVTRASVIQENQLLSKL